jgi:hypothetical protein
MNDVQTLIDLISNIEIGSAATAGNLALLSTSLAGPADHSGYLLYEQAQEMGLVSIQEVSEAGTVSELRVANRAGRPILLVEGEVLLGMKQTRVLNLTILVPAHTILEVPVSCVESGRWRAVSGEATGKAVVNLAPSVRAAKTVTVARSMRGARGFASDQGAVWAGVDRVLDRHGAQAPSRSYADLPSGANSRMTGIASSVEPEPGQVGVIACVGGRVACVDVFETPHVLAALWGGLVSSYQAEVFMVDSTSTKPLAVRADTAARRWFRSIASGSAVVGPEIGLGAHVTVVAPEVEAAALVQSGRVLHLSAFPAHQSVTATRFAPPARRRN